MGGHSVRGCRKWVKSDLRWDHWLTGKCGQSTPARLSHPTMFQSRSNMSKARCTCKRNDLSGFDLKIWTHIQWEFFKTVCILNLYLTRTIWHHSVSLVLKLWSLVGFYKQVRDWIETVASRTWTILFVIETKRHICVSKRLFLCGLSATFMDMWIYMFPSLWFFFFFFFSHFMRLDGLACPNYLVGKSDIIISFSLSQNLIWVQLLMPTPHALSCFTMPYYFIVLLWFNCCNLWFLHGLGNGDGFLQ